MRLFIAVPLSSTLKQTVQPLLAELANFNADLKIVPQQNLHFTVKFLGYVNEQKIPEIETKLTKLAQQFTTFELILHRSGGFPNERSPQVIWLGIESPPLIELMNAADQALNYIKLNEHQQNTAHLTLARVKTASKQLSDFIKKHQTDHFGKMKVNSIILYESKLSRSGPEYIALKEFKFKN